ncbi:MAG: class I SAM-dependent methyltransferase [Candidatus Rokubacteria bacterium]|nr:class I SAM-dependent methyltransferase [Candidatus Rokubacteria bacterium]
MTAAAAAPLTFVACPLCGERRSVLLHWLRDVTLGIEGRFSLARCDGCGLLYQNPRVPDDRLGSLYPPHYAAHAREPALSRILRRDDRLVRWVLRTRLGYAHLPIADVTAADRLRAWTRTRRIVKAFPPWIGAGRLLDVGCASGRFLRQMVAVGWDCAGIEADAEAAAKAKTVTPRVVVGDPCHAAFPEGSFDVITSFHVLEHLPRPREALARMLGWLAPGGVMIVEVPNVAGAGALVFGRYWSGLDPPRHLVHFTPRTMRAMVERAGGRVVAEIHRTKPRYVLRSLRHVCAARGGGLASALDGVLASRVGRAVTKGALELLMPLARPLRRGEAVRYVIARADAA